MIIKFVAMFAVLITPSLAQVLDPKPPEVKTACCEPKLTEQPNAVLPEDAPGSIKDEPNANPPREPGPDAAGSTPQQAGEQTKRILYIVPNFHSVSADTKLPRESKLDKLKDATFDSFDYSSVIFAAGVAGASQAGKSVPEFRQGSVGYARYFWHSFVDQTDENYIVEGFMPILLREDTRYYTMEHGSARKRILYSFSRMWITRKDNGDRTPNYSEIVGAGAAAGISNLYYPEPERTWTKTGQRWVTNIAFDAFTDVFKEFWPDLNRHVFHQR